MRSQLPKKSEESINNAIMKIINSWRKKQTPQYMSYTKDGKSDTQYLAGMFKKAGIPWDDAFAFVKKELGGWYDQTRQDDFMKEFDDEYNESEYDEAWKIRAFKNIL